MIMMSDASINDVDDHEHEANNNSHRIQQLLLHQQQQPQPTRITSFLRQNQYKTGTKILVPLFYLALTIFYFHSLLFRNVESSGGGGNARHHHQQQQENSNNDSNLIQLTKEEDSSPLLLLEPRSLAHVALANAEIAWRRHVDRENYLIRQAQRREERAKELRMKQQQEQQNNVEKAALLRGAGNVDDTNDAASLTQNSAGGNNEDTNKSPSKNSTKEELEAAAEYLKNVVRGGTAGSLAAAIVAGRGAASERKLPSTTTMAVGGERMAIHGSIDSTKNHNYRRTSSSPGFLPLLLIMFTCSMLRVCVQVLVVQEHDVVAGGGRGGIGLDDTDDDDDESSNNASTTTRRRRRGRGTSRRSGEGGEQQPHGTMGVGGVLTAAARLRRRARISAAQHQFQRFANRLNAERAANGERQISIDTLRHLVHARDFNGNDYDRLSNFVEENGPAIGSFFSAIGATDAEINRCPSRILMENDELLRWRMSSSVGSGRRGSTSSSSRQGVEDQPIQQQQTDPPSSSCAVCLEQYQVGEMVRTIPCFHTFHATCIDPWLAQRAECPVCKHSAIG